MTRQSGAEAFHVLFGVRARQAGVAAGKTEKGVRTDGPRTPLKTVSI
jgi:hypothetical protein